LGQPAPSAKAGRLSPGRRLRDLSLPRRACEDGARTVGHPVRTWNLELGTWNLELGTEHDLRRQMQKAVTLRARNQAGPELCW
jgi:hypothetical protein